MPNARATNDSTTDPELRSWVTVPARSDFPIQNLPFGAFREGAESAHLCIAIGDSVLDLWALARAGVLDGVAPDALALFCAPGLGPLLAAGRPVWRAARERLSGVLRAGDTTIADAGLERTLLDRSNVRLVLPFDVNDYVDFYSSLDHATNVGKIFRPNAPALSPNWRYLPVGYHGRAGTVVASGAPIVRPRGQIKSDDGPPVYAATNKLDFELEMGFVTGNGPAPPAGVSVSGARDVIFGAMLLNDWSARDVQAWENQPLGPFLSKSFATTVSPWIVSLDALEPFRVAGPRQDPPPLPHLAPAGDESYDVALEVLMTSAAMRERGLQPQRLSRSNFRTMYWSMAQQLAHASSNGASVRAGDLFGSGTISGSVREAYGCLLELTWGGTQPFELADGTMRTYLENGDEIVMRGWCEETPDRVHIGFGALSGGIVSCLH
jgi:fumarylacetoacetase